MAVLISDSWNNTIQSSCTWPNTCLIKLRQFGELLTKHVAAQHRLPEQENFAATIHLLQREGVHATVIQGFHDLRRAGNDAIASPKTAPSIPAPSSHPRTPATSKSNNSRISSKKL